MSNKNKKPFANLKERLEEQKKEREDQIKYGFVSPERIFSGYTKSYKNKLKKVK